MFEDKIGSATALLLAIILPREPMRITFEFSAPVLPPERSLVKLLLEGRRFFFLLSALEEMEPSTELVAADLDDNASVEEGEGKPGIALGMVEIGRGGGRCVKTVNPKALPLSELLDFTGTAASAAWGDLGDGSAGTEGGRFSAMAISAILPIALTRTIYRIKLQPSVIAYYREGGGATETRQDKTRNLLFSNSKIQKI